MSDPTANALLTRIDLLEERVRTFKHAIQEHLEAEDYAYAAFRVQLPDTAQRRAAQRVIDTVERLRALARDGD
jgi:hypothetical protein